MDVQTPTTVSISRLDSDIRSSVRQAIDLVGGLKVNKNSKILIKPNLAFGKIASTGITTNPLVVDAILTYLLRRGASKDNILVGEASTTGFDTLKIFRKTGMAELCESKSISYEDLFNTNFVTKVIETERRGLRFDVSEEVFDRDLIINVPVVKTHSQTGVSIALKNMKGTISAETRKVMHLLGIHEAIAYLNKVILNERRYFTVADGTIGLMGMGPGILGKPANLNLILAGWDPVAVDRVACEITELDIAPHIIHAANIGVGEQDLRKIKTVGADIPKVKKKFEPAVGRLSTHPNVESIDGLACSGCTFNIWFALRDLGKEHLKTQKKIEITYGPHLNEGMCSNLPKICVGDCAKMKHLAKYHVKGCPPTIKEILTAMKRLFNELK